MAETYFPHWLRLERMVILLGIFFIFCSAVEGDHTNGAVKSIKSEDGDIIDCIDIYSQPAFNHPALKNHRIQMAPSSTPIMEEEAATTKTDASKTRQGNSSKTITSQVWQKSGSCPKGTIAVRRTLQKKQVKTSSTAHHAMNKHNVSQKVEQHDDHHISNFLQMNRSKAILITEGYNYIGAKADIKVCWPYVESDDEYSAAQITLVNGGHIDYDLIESGWAINPRVYGDRTNRLFIYWTVDGSRKTGCFDLTCPGFVQTSNEIALGAAIYPMSAAGSIPYEIIIYLYKDLVTRNWWVQYGEKTNIGYWPAELLTRLSHTCEVVEWGGQVYTTKLYRPHTKTGMGCGDWPSIYFGAYFQRMRILDNSLVLRFPEWVYGHSDEYNCYDVQYLGDYIEDPMFFYGGPGGRDDIRCP